MCVWAWGGCVGTGFTAAAAMNIHEIAAILATIKIHILVVQKQEVYDCR